MSMSQSPNKPPHIKLPNFEPLPPDKWWNRLINNLLKPIFYLVFTLVTSIVIVPIFTIIENLKARNRAQRGETRAGSRSAYTMNGQPVEAQDGKLQDFLKGYGNSYGKGAHARKAH